MNDHKSHERKALVIKIDKLCKWLRMYWDGRIKAKPQDALEVSMIISKAELELTLL